MAFLSTAEYTEKKYKESLWIFIKVNLKLSIYPIVKTSFPGFNNYFVSNCYILTFIVALILTRFPQKNGSWY